MVYKFIEIEENRLQLIDQGRLWNTNFDVYLTYNGNKKPLLRVFGKHGTLSTEYTQITDADRIQGALKQQGVNKKRLRTAKMPDSIDKRVIAGWINLVEWLERS